MNIVQIIFLPLGGVLRYAKVQGLAPDFKGTAVVNGSFKEISLDDFKGKYLVLFFYPLDLLVEKFIVLKTYSRNCLRSLCK